MIRFYKTDFSHLLQRDRENLKKGDTYIEKDVLMFERKDGISPLGVPTFHFLDRATEKHKTEYFVEYEKFLTESEVVVENKKASKLSAGSVAKALKDLVK